MKIIVYYNGMTFEGDAMDPSDPEVCRDFDWLRDKVTECPNNFSKLDMLIDGNRAVFPKEVLSKSVIIFVDSRESEDT